MSALPYPSQLAAPHGQTDTGGRPDGAGQPDRRATAAGAPIYRLDYDAGAPLYLVRCYLTEFIVSNSWVIGWPGRFMGEAGAAYKCVEMQMCNAIDEQLPPVDWRTTWSPD